MKLKIGLALGGGAARGYAHFGALFALERSSIPIHCVAGTSIGAAVGGLWATYQLIDCYQVLRKLTPAKVRELLDPELPLFSGFIKGEKLHQTLESWFKGYLIENLTKEFCANAVNLSTGKEETFHSGNLADIIRASVSVPVILAPWHIGNQPFVDGGVINPLPVRQCRDMGADIVIAVNLLGVVPKVSSKDEAQIEVLEKAKRFHLPENILDAVNEIPLIHQLRNPRIPETAFASVLLTQKALTDANLKLWKPDFLIQPDLSEFNGSEFHSVEQISNIGLKATEKIIPHILKDLSL